MLIASIPAILLALSFIPGLAGAITTTSHLGGNSIHVTVNCVNGTQQHQSATSHNGQSVSINVNCGNGGTGQQGPPGPPGKNGQNATVTIITANDNNTNTNTNNSTSTPPATNNCVSIEMGCINK